MKKRILVVEDEPITAMEAELIVCDLGYELAGVAASDEDAVRQARDERPDVILMDISLNGKMDGREATAEILKFQNVPVVFVTAYGDKRESLSGNLTVPKGFGYVVKPYTSEELQNEIQRSCLTLSER